MPFTKRPTASKVGDRRLAKEPGYDGLTTTVAPRVEIVHLASEQGDAETLKAAVPTLTKAVNDQLAALMK